MRAADKVALLTALKDATEAELAKARAEALALANEVGVKSFDTPFGNITVARSASKPYVKDPAMLLAYVQHNHPTEVVTVPTVRPSFITALLNRVEWSTELQEFVDTATGEAVPGIDLSEEGDPKITWPAGDAQRSTKQEAKAWFSAQSEQILDGIRSITA